MINKIKDNDKIINSEKIDIIPLRFLDLRNTLFKNSSMRYKYKINENISQIIDKRGNNKANRKEKILNLVLSKDNKYNHKYTYFKKETYFKIKVTIIIILSLITIICYKKFLLNKLIFNNDDSFSKQVKIHKIIIMIFAGRKNYLFNLMIYLNYLLKKNKIHEIHLWQFSNNIQDVKYFETISNLHKTSSKYIEYREIFPKIHKKKFIIGIKSTKGGAYLLINNKYEIVFNINNTNYSLLTNIINNEMMKIKGSKIPNNTFLFYKIEIDNHLLLIKEKNIILFQYKINEDNFLSIKIHSEKNSENFWDYKEMKNKNIKLFDTENRATPDNWYEAYKYYLTYDFEILVKIDDDIVYMDINRFDDYINFIRNNKNINVTIPNLINHAVSLFYNNKYGLIPTDILKKKYINKNSSIEVYDYFQDGEQAEIIHKYFLSNINKFINNNIDPINLNGQIPSICVFGINKRNFNKVYNSLIVGELFKRRNENNEIIGFNDEVYTFSLKNNYFFPKFICVHYQFGPQINNGLSQKFLDDYKKLTNLLLNLL